MQGQSPAVSISAQTGTNPTQNANKEWTCQRWFNNIATKVSTKTHRYVGKFVAVVTLPIIFIPSLARDLICGTKNLYQRVVNKVPVANQVSSNGSTEPPAATHTANTDVLAPIVRPDSAQAHSYHIPPSIEQLRKDFPELNQVICAMEASAEETEHQLCNQIAKNRELTDKLALSQQALSNCATDIGRLQNHSTNLQRKLEELTAKNYRHLENIDVLNRKIDDLETEKSGLIAACHDLSRRLGIHLHGRPLSSGLDCVEEESSEFCPDDLQRPDQPEIIVLEVETPSTTEGETLPTPEGEALPTPEGELDEVIVALNDAITEPECEDLDEPALPVAQVSSLSVELSDSDESFEAVTVIPNITVTNHGQSAEVEPKVE